MKNLRIKSLLTIAMLFITTLTFAQTEQNPLKEITETERIIDKYSDKLVDGFNSIVETATPVAEEGFKIAVKLQIIDGITWMLCPIMLIVVSILYGKEATRIRNCTSYDEYSGIYDCHHMTFLLVFYTALVIILTGMTVAAVFVGIPKLFVPEWYAIKEILEAVRY